MEETVNSNTCIISTIRNRAFFQASTEHLSNLTYTYTFFHKICGPYYWPEATTIHNDFSFEDVTFEI